MPKKKLINQTGNGQNNVLLYAILAIYAIVIIWGVSNHEQWRDEAQAWLIVRDTSFTELFKVLRTEGHPPLWYLLIMPFVKSGAPYIFQNWLTVAIMIGAVYFIFFKTNLPLIIKLLLPFSYFFFYEYSFFARSYCLIAFFVAAIISLYPDRFKKPWLYALCIAGLFNTHVLVFTFCGMLVLLYIWELYEQKIKDRQAVMAAIFMAVSGGYLLPYLFMAKMADEFDKGINDNWGQVIRAVNNGITIEQSAVLAGILLLAVVVLLFRQKKAFLLILGGCVSVVYILGFKYSSSDLRHQGVLFFILLTSIYVAAMEERDTKKIWLNMRPAELVLLVILIIQLKPSFEHYVADIEHPFSGAKDAAEYLQDNKLDKKIIVGHQAWAASALLPFMDKDTRMFYGECGRYGTYYIYDSCFINNRWQYPVEVSVDAAYNNFAGKLDSVVLVFNYPANQKAMQFLDLLHTTPETPLRVDEAFYIYRFKTGVK